MQVISFKKNIHTALLIQIAMLYQMFVSYFYFLFLYIIMLTSKDIHLPI